MLGLSYVHVISMLFSSIGMLVWHTFGLHIVLCNKYVVQIVRQMCLQFSSPYTFAFLLAMMLYDLGAIQLLKNLRKIILVTKDKFSINAQACFYNDDRRYNHDALTADIDRQDLPFITVESCKELVLCLGRIPAS